MKVWFLLVLSAIALLGEDFSLKVEGVQHEILVSLPENHDSSQKWPAVFYYHGTNGRPNTSLIRGHAGDEDWIVVGMSYARLGTFQLTPTGMDEEIRVLKQVSAELEKRANLDPARIYLSGFSKGGWVSGLLLQRERSLAGAAILGAGHMHKLEAVPKPFTEKTPVFLAVGRFDRNYPFSLRALLFYRQLGAEVQMETWRGIGHAFPDYGSTGLKEWLALQIGERPDEAALEVELAAILGIENEFERWWGLLEFEERPFVKATEGWSAKAAVERQLLEKEPAVLREARILQESRRLLAKEIGKKTLPDLEQIVAGYARIAESAKGSAQGEVATKDFERVAEILDLAREQYGEQQRPQPTEVKPETERRRIPSNPLVR